MKKIMLTAITLITLCSFGNNKSHTIQRRQGILINTSKGFEFIPLEDWKDYQPKSLGDTCFQYKVS